jgi:hypothetical protein
MADVKPMIVMCDKSLPKSTIYRPLFVSRIRIGERNYDVNQLVQPESGHSFNRVGHHEECFRGP